nr:craniofacial development protein 2-like [Parasteatoda tepidariorum]
MTCEIPNDSYLTWNEEITPMKCRRESHLEPSMRKKSLMKPKHKLRIGAWNVRTMYQCGKSRQVSMEMDRYQLDILGISELRWTGFGKIKTGSEQIILYSGAEEKHERGVALIINKETAKSLLEWEPISERILRARFYSKYIKLSIIQVYAPTNDADEEEKETFYDQLQCVLNRVPKHDMIILMGDLNAKVGKRISDDETSMGNESPGERNENGELFVSLCELNSLNIGGSRFKHREIHKCTWTSPDGRTKNQIDHIAINNKFRSSLRDVRAMRGADVGSDHYLILAILKLKLRKSPKKTGHKRISYDIAKLKAKECRQEFSIELKNRFELLKEEENHGNTKQSENEVSGVLTNTGHSVAFRISNLHPSVPINISGGPLSYKYRFHELHLHYGQSDDKGSEHTVSGISFPGESIASDSHDKNRKLKPYIIKNNK